MVAPSKVQFRHSAFHCYVLGVEIKPVGRETAVGRYLVTTVCLKELASCQIWGADGYEFAVGYNDIDVSVRPVACSAWYIVATENETPWGRIQHYSSKLNFNYKADHTACDPMLLQYVRFRNRDCNWRVSDKALGEELWCLVSLLLCNWNCAASLYNW
jgi:hypothetical protein